MARELMPVTLPSCAGMRFDSTQSDRDGFDMIYARSAAVALDHNTSGAGRGHPMFSRLIAAPLFLLISGCGPFLLLPGAKLNGATAAVPSDWSITDEVNTVQLETNPEDPYSVNIWAVGMGPLLYAHAGANRSRWVENMEDNPDVRLRVAGEIYDLRASRVEGQDEFDRFSDAYQQKYGSRPRNENVDEAYLFRLEGR